MTISRMRARSRLKPARDRISHGLAGNSTRCNGVLEGSSHCLLMAGCDPLRGRAAEGGRSGGIARSSLNPRLMAVNPSGSGSAGRDQGGGLLFIAPLESVGRLARNHYLTPANQSSSLNPRLMALNPSGSGFAGRAQGGGLLFIAPLESVGRLARNRCLTPANQILTPANQILTPVSQILTPARRQIEFSLRRPEALSLRPGGKLLVAAGKIGVGRGGGSRKRPSTLTISCILPRGSTKTDRPAAAVFEPEGFTAISRGLSEERAIPPEHRKKRADPGRGRSPVEIARSFRQSKVGHDRRTLAHFTPASLQTANNPWPETSGKPPGHE